MRRLTYDMKLELNSLLRGFGEGISDTMVLNPVVPSCNFRDLLAYSMSSDLLDSCCSQSRVCPILTYLTLTLLSGPCTGDHEASSRLGTGGPTPATHTALF